MREIKFLENGISQIEFSDGLVELDRSDRFNYVRKEEPTDFLNGDGKVERIYKKPYNVD